MSTTTVADTITRMEHSFILKALAIIIGFGMLILSLTFIVWGTFFQSQTKILSGVNYYDIPIVVQFGQNKVQLNAFESYNYSTDVVGTVTVSVSDLQGNVLATRTHNLSRAASVIIDILSKNDIAKLCYTEANVTNLFFNASDTSDLITELKVITDKAASSINYEMPAVTETTLYPGHYDGKVLPNTLDSQQRVWGVYPVDCANINDKAKLSAQVLNWTENNPENLRNQYAQKIQEINNSPEYNH